MSTYVYHELVDASGTVNVIAVVKYASKPKKTKGSGYSLFMSLTDPSLNGSKFPCVIFNDSEEKLPQIHSPGDVIIMHRLVVKQYQGKSQGCGYGASGFTAAVFSGVHSDPLIPRQSPKICSFGDDELKCVDYLRKWFVSPECPVEHEPPVLNATSMQCMMQTKRNNNMFVKRINDAESNEFCTIEGQIVSIYNCETDGRYLIMYLWDGSVSPDHQKVFCEPSQGSLLNLIPSSKLDPIIVALTAHGLKRTGNVADFVEDESSRFCTGSQNDLRAMLAVSYLQELNRRRSNNVSKSIFPADWSVPVFVYDEHATNSNVSSLIPGDLVRIHNVHVVACRQHECSRPSCVRLTLHGGGHKFGRGIERLGSIEKLHRFMYDDGDINSDEFCNLNQYGLLKNLKDGFHIRTPVLHPPSNLSLPEELKTVLCISQICNIPLAFHNEKTKTDDWDLLFPVEFPIIPFVCSSFWIDSPDCLVSSKSNSVCARLAARIANICPSNQTMLKDALLLICQKCRSAMRASCLPDNDGFVLPEQSDCTPRIKQTIDAVTSFTSGFCASKTVEELDIYFELEDSTGHLILSVTGQTVISLLRKLIADSELQSYLNAPAWWANLILEIPELQSTTKQTPCELIITCMNQLLGQWIDILVKISWPKQTIPIQYDQLDIKFELFDWEML